MIIIKKRDILLIIQLDKYYLSPNEFAKYSVNLRLNAEGLSE